MTKLSSRLELGPARVIPGIYVSGKRDGYPTRISRSILSWPLCVEGC